MRVARLAVVSVFAFGVAACSSDSPSTTAASASGSATTTTTTAPPPTASSPQASVPHIWPFDGSGTRFATPDDAARSFAVDYLGMTNARVGATGAGNVEIFASSTGGARTLVDVVSTSTGYVVTGARADQIVVDHPQPGDDIERPQVHVSGRSTAFEAQLGLEIRTLGSKTAASRGTAMGGSNGEMGPFSTTVDTPPGSPLVLVVDEGDASGQQTFTKATVVLLGTGVEVPKSSAP